MDTIHFKLNIKHFDYNDVLNVLQYKLNSNGSFKQAKGLQSKSIYAQHRNWKFTLTDYNLIGKGSITKFYYGHNVKNICFEDLQLALLQLQTVLEVDLTNAEITRVDIGFNLIMSKPVFNYLPLLVCPKGFKDFNVTNETREFRGKGQGLIFYDKIKEAGKRKIPKGYRPLNLLRYELKCEKALLKEIASGHLTFGELYNENLYESFVNTWFNRFLLLSTVSSSITSKINYSSVTSWKCSLASMAIQTLGGVDFVNQLIMTNCVNPKVKHDVKEALKKMNITSDPGAPFFEELRQKIAVEYCRQLPDRFSYIDYEDTEELA
jgi:hypothetical protein